MSRSVYNPYFLERAGSIPRDSTLSIKQFGLNTLVLDDLLASVPISMIDSGDAHGRTPLWWAAYRSDYPTILSLLRYNVDIYKPSNGGWHALSTAMSTKKQRCVRLLMQSDPDLSRFDSRGWLAFHHAAWYNLGIDIVIAAIPPGMSINVVLLENRSTALMLAAQMNYHQLCECLLSRGADPNFQDSLGETALYYAIEYNSHRTIPALIQNRSISIKTEVGETVLHCAAQHSDIRSLKIL